MKKIYIILISIFFVNTLSSDDDWLLINPNLNPGLMSGHTMAYIGDDKVLLFDNGSHGYAPLNETWVYDLSDNTWTQLNPGDGPDTRWLQGMSYIGEDKVLLFSGDRHGLEDLNDTWVYDLSDNTWTLMNPQTSPSARYGYGIAYIGGDKIIIYGGHSSGTIVFDTWIYDLSDNNWTQVSPWPQPSTRADHAMCYIGDDKAVLFGGGSWSATPNDTWIYDLSENSWTDMNATNSPTVRVGHDMAYMGNGRALLFGGEDQDLSVLLGDTWIYDLSTNTWTEDTNQNNPSERNLYGLATTSIENPSRLILFAGGNYSNDNNETWLFGGGDYELKVNSICSPNLDDLLVLPAYPNPFNPSTTITYGLNVNSNVRIAIYDLSGHLITNLINTEQPQGWHTIEWNGTDSNSNQVPAGIYLSKITSNNNTKTTKLMLLK